MSMKPLDLRIYGSGSYTSRNEYISLSSEFLCRHFGEIRRDAKRAYNIGKRITSLI